MRFVCAALASAVLLGGCWNGPPGGADEFVGTWYNAAGSPLPDSLHGTSVLVLHAFTGSEHCGWQSVVFLNLAWPIGIRASTGDGEVRQYVRDPTGVVSADLAGRFQAVPSLPGDVRYTGYHHGIWQLWLSDSDQRGAYLIGPARAERWPLNMNAARCE